MRERKDFPASPTPVCVERTEYAGYIRTATERTLERLGSDHLDLLLLHNPDRIGYRARRFGTG